MNSQLIDVDYCNRAPAFKWLWATIALTLSVLTYYAVLAGSIGDGYYVSTAIVFVISSFYVVATLVNYQVLSANSVYRILFIAVTNWLLMSYTVTHLWQDGLLTEKLLLIAFFSMLICFNSSKMLLVVSTLPIIIAHIIYQVSYEGVAGMALFVSVIKFPFFIIAIIVTQVNHNARLIKSHKRLVELNRELVTLRNTDALTQLFNRRAFDEKLKYLMELHNRSQQPISLMLIDIDYFKRYNDSFGHLQGDECLRQVSQSMGETIKRETDVVARVGGEEFAVILPNTTLQDCQILATSLIDAIAALNIEHPNSDVSDKVTISIGCTCVYGVLSTVHSIYDRADKALYAAKDQGRNRFAI